MLHLEKDLADWKRLGSDSMDEDDLSGRWYYAEAVFGFG